MPWWAWLLIALAVAALLWLLFALFNNDADEAVDPALVPVDSPAAGATIGSPSPAAGATNASPAAIASPTPDASPSAATTATLATGDTITDPALILIPVAERPALVGRPVLIETVPVQSVPGDRTFLVGPDQDQPLLVVLDETQSAGQTEGQVDVNPGQTVSIVGQIQALPDMEEARQQWNLDDETLSQIEDDQVYVLATQVAIVDQAAGASPAATATSASSEASASPTAGATGASPAASPSPAAVGGGTEPLADVLVIIDTPDQTTLVGREVALQTVQVQRVTGDVTFWVGPSDDPEQQVLVVLDESSTSNDQTEGRYDVTPGQTINLYGEVRAFPGVEALQEEFNLTADDLQDWSDEQIYLFAERLEIVERP
jgi:hypothetical protein